MLENHPLAELFPALAGDAWLKLAADIKTHGLLEPITLYEGKILDGRNRYKICFHELKIEPRFVEFKGSDPTAFVLSKNLHRRHLSESQRSMVAARLARMSPGGQSGNKNAKEHHVKRLRKFADPCPQRMPRSP